MEEYYYDLADDSGISSIELPVKMEAGSVFTCEYGRYRVEDQSQIPENYKAIYCERI